MEAAGVKQPVISTIQGSALRTGLGLSWNKYRKQRKFLRTIGVSLASEKSRKKKNRKKKTIQENIKCGQVKLEDKLLFQSDRREHVTTPVSYVGSDDLPDFVCNLLDQYEEEGLLTWHKHTTPSLEVWMNIGGDYGGDSFKLMLQIANVTEANSKRNTCLITIASCKDSHENLKIILKPYREQISNLEKTSWKGKRIHVFLFGDYDFELKVYGISGAQSVHLCLW